MLPSIKSGDRDSVDLILPPRKSWQQALAGFWQVLMRGRKNVRAEW
jgi:hypothetical protein